MIEREEMPFGPALINMTFRGDNYQSVKAPWIIFRVENGIIEQYHESNPRWVACEALPCDWIMGKWVKV